MGSRDQVREMLRAELSKHRPIGDARRPLELIAETSLRFVDNGPMSYQVVDYSGKPRTIVRDGQTVDMTIEDLVTELRGKHPALFERVPADPAEASRPAPVHAVRTPEPTSLRDERPGPALAEALERQQPALKLADAAVRVDDMTASAAEEPVSAPARERAAVVPVAAQSPTPSPSLPGRDWLLLDSSDATRDRSPVPDRGPAQDQSRERNPAGDRTAAAAASAAQERPFPRLSPLDHPPPGGPSARAPGAEIPVGSTGPSGIEVLRQRFGQAVEQVSPRLESAAAGLTSTARSLGARFSEYRTHPAVHRLRSRVGQVPAPYRVGIVALVLAFVLIASLVGYFVTRSSPTVAPATRSGTAAVTRPAPPPTSSPAATAPTATAPAATAPAATPPAPAAPAPAPAGATAARPAAPAAGPLTGVPEVLDTGTLRLEGKVIRLFGVEWARGAQAEDLARYLRGRSVTCQPVPAADAFRCEVDGHDLSEAVLFNGGGRATAAATPELLAAETRARSERLGIWKR